MMGDSVYLALFKADFSDLKQIKGELRLKIHYRSVLGCETERSDSCKLSLNVIN